MPLQQLQREAGSRNPVTSASLQGVRIGTKHRKRGVSQLSCWSERRQLGGWTGAWQTEGVKSPLFRTNGRVPLRKETVALLVAEIEKTMQAAGELERGSFR